VNLTITRLPSNSGDDDGLNNYLFVLPDPDYIAISLFDISMKYTIVGIDFHVSYDAFAGDVPVSKGVALDLEIGKSSDGKTNITGEVVEAILKLYR
jgi:hypothetical protein